MKLRFILVILSLGLFPAAYGQRTKVDKMSKHKIGLSYAFIHFDKRFDDAWHFSSFSYAKQNKWGSSGLSFNYANRFRQNGSELELETYPKFKKGLYAYVGGAVKISEKNLFPNYRVGMSVYKSLPRKFEFEGGIRHLVFDRSVNVFVLGVGKYAGNAFYNLRSYLTPKKGSMSKTFILSGRFYFSDDRNDYWAVQAGTGISPDDRSQISNSIDQLKSLRLGGDYSKNINPRTILRFGFQWMNEEYKANTFGSQFGINASFSRKF